MKHWVAITLMMLPYGCGHSVPESERAKVERCDRPENIDLGQIERVRFEIDGKDVLSQPFEAMSDSTHTIRGELEFKSDPELAKLSYSIILAYRKRIDGEVDWTVSPCDLEGRNERFFTPKIELSDGRTIAAIEKPWEIPDQPGEYEVRLYLSALDERDDFSVPTIFHIGRGRVNVVERQ